MKKAQVLSLKVLLCLLCLSALSVKGEILQGPFLLKDTRQNPAGVEWAVLRTEHFNVIFPRALENEARRVSGILEVVYAPVAEGLSSPPRPLDIVLQAHLLESNGFVTLAPRRSEWFVAPWLGPDVGQTEWLHTLAAHEFRHVVQFEKSRDGFERFLRVLFGETGTALAIGLSLPPWYLEGDAVGIETALSSGGRGRMPHFARDLRTLLLDGQDYDYDKLALGSFDHFIPNHYVVGYHLTTYLKRRFGKDILEKMHARTMPNAFWPLSFFNSLEDLTGVKFDDAYADCLQELTQMWRAQDALVQQVVAQSIDIDGVHGWTNFSFPSRLSDGSYLAYRAGLGHFGQFVKITNGQKADVQWTPAPLVQDYPYKIRAGKIAYSELSVDSRWGAQEFTKVVVKSVAGETVFRSEQSQWLLPVLDHQGARIAVMEWAYQGDPNLKILSLKGETLASIPWKRDYPVMGLDWIAGSDKLVVLYRDGTYQQVLAELTLQGQRRELARASQWNWAYPVANSTHVYFQSSASGIDNIHRISLRDGLEERVTSERFGAYHPSLDGEYLSFASYTPQGLRPASLKLSGAKILPPGPDSFVPYYAPLVKQEGKGDILKQVTRSEAKLEEYSLPKHAYNAHSWTLIGDYFGSSITPALVTTDVLNNLQTVVGLGWNLNERTAQGYASARWSYFYPVFDLAMGFGSRREVDLPIALYGKREDVWEEGSAEVGMTLPWRSVWRRWMNNSSVRLSQAVYHSTGRSYVETGDLTNETLSVPGVAAQFSMLSRQAPRDLMPPWGFEVSGRWKEGKDMAGKGSDLSYQKRAALRPFFSGPLRHHHLFGEISHEEQEKFGYHFASPTLFARGWQGRFLEKQTKTSANYAFPLFYPDWSLSRYFYLKRVSFNAFYDNLWGTRYGNNVRYETTGSELWFDSNFLRNAFTFQWGLRYSHPLSQREDDSAELFLNMALTTY